MGAAPAAPFSAASRPGRKQASMNTYEAKQEARLLRLLDQSARLLKAAELRAGRAARKASIIPLGQPILVGHHSERRDRRYREGIQRDYMKAAELQREAQAAAQRASSVGMGGISSDDPEAVRKLGEQLEAERAERADYKRARALFKKGGWDAVLAAEPSLMEKTRRYGEMVQRVHGPLEPFPAYHLALLGANVRRIEKRIGHLRTLAAALSCPDEVTTAGAWTFTLSEDAPANRIVILTDGPRLPKAVFLIPRGYGFLWSRTENRWQRKRGAWAMGQAAIQRMAQAIEDEAKGPAPTSAPSHDDDGPRGGFSDPIHY
jgi:hypothetical protein